MSTIKSDQQSVADDLADPGAAEPARAFAELGGSSLPKVVASVWKEAHALYLLLRRGCSEAGPERSNFDSAWNVWTDNTPDHADPEALIYANRALSFYQRANSSAAVANAEIPANPELNGALASYWTIGEDMARLAGTIEATRPTPSAILAGGTIGTEDELKAHLDEVEAGLARVLAGLRAIRNTVVS